MHWNHPIGWIWTASKIRANGFTYIAKFMSAVEKIIDAIKYKLCFFIFSSEFLNERTLNEWNVSAMDIVKNAIDVP